MNPFAQVDLSSAPGWVAGFAGVCAALGLGFVRVYTWIQSEGEKQRKERETAVTAAEDAIRKEYDPRIEKLEKEIHAMRQENIAIRNESTQMKKLILSQCGEIFRYLEDPATHKKEIGGCVRTIMEAAG